MISFQLTLIAVFTIITIPLKAAFCELKNTMMTWFSTVEDLCDQESHRKSLIIRVRRILTDRHRISEMATIKKYDHQEEYALYVFRSHGIPWDSDEEWSSSGQNFKNTTNIKSIVAFFNQPSNSRVRSLPRMYICCRKLWRGNCSANQSETRTFCCVFLLYSFCAAICTTQRTSPDKIWRKTAFLINAYSLCAGSLSCNETFSFFLSKK